MSISNSVALAMEMARRTVHLTTVEAYDNYSVVLGECDIKIWTSGGPDPDDVGVRMGTWKDWETADVTDAAGKALDVSQYRLVHVGGFYRIVGSGLEKAGISGSYRIKIRMYKSRRCGAREGPWQLQYLAYMSPSHCATDRPRGRIYCPQSADMAMRGHGGLGAFKGIVLPVTAVAVCEWQESALLVRHLEMIQ